MKNASERMFRYGNIVNIVYFVLAIILLVIAPIALVVGFVGEDGEAVSSGWECLFSGAHLLVATILCRIYVINRAEKEANYSGNASNSPFIMSIVFGAISGNPFYILAGIFGLVAQGQARNNPEPKQVEEEPKPVEEEEKPFEEEPEEVKEENKEQE